MFLKTLIKMSCVSKVWLERLPFAGISSFPFYRRNQKVQVFNLTKS